jgi:hypothetical protein
VIAVGLLVVFVGGIGAAVVGASLAGVPTAGMDDPATLGRLPEQIARGTLAIIEEAALGFTIATLARSQLAGIGAGIALYFGESFARLFLPDIVKVLPFTVANSAVATGAGGLGGGGGAAAIARLEPNAALGLVVVWLVGSLLVTAIVAERAEISG